MTDVTESPDDSYLPAGEVIRVLVVDDHALFRRGLEMVLEAGPRLLLLDEPSLGLSPGNQDQVFVTLQDLRNSGMTVLVVEQNAEGCLAVSDRAIVMELGQKFLEGSARDVITDSRIRDAYLGGSRTRTPATT